MKYKSSRKKNDKIVNKSIFEEKLDQQINVKDFCALTKNDQLERIGVKNKDIEINHYDNMVNIKNLIDNKQRKCLYKILAIVPAWIPSVVLGVFKPLRYMEEKELIEFECRLEKDVQFIDLLPYDIVIFQRTGNVEMLKFLNFCKNVGIGVVYDIDDNFLEFPKGTPIGDLYNQPSIRNTIIEFCEKSNYIKAGSIEIKKTLDKYNNNVEVHPGSVDFELIKGVEKISKGEKVTIGYAGTLGHAADFQIVLPAIKRILSEYKGRVKFEFMGYKPEELIGHPDVECFEFNTNYEDFLKKKYSRNWDIGLAPLNDNIINRSKANNKYREYSICEIAGIYTDLPVYSRCIKDKQNGTLVKHNGQQWYMAMKLLIDNKDLREKIILNAKNDVLNNYSLDKISTLWIELFHKFKKRDLNNSDEINKFIYEFRNIENNLCINTEGNNNKNNLITSSENMAAEDPRKSKFSLYDIIHLIKDVRNEIRNRKYYKSNEAQIFLNSPLLSGKVHTQKFISLHDNIKGISIFLSTYSRVNNCSLNFRFYDEYKMVYSTRIKATSLIDNSMRAFKFENHLTNCKGKWFKFEIYSNDTSKDNFVSTWCTNIRVNHMERVLNGKKKNGNLYFDILT